MTASDTTPRIAPARLDMTAAIKARAGLDDAGDRLGYGGGSFDRTLAALSPRPVGIGLRAARLAAIHPQLHDIPLDVILTEAGVEAICEAP